MAAALGVLSIVPSILLVLLCSLNVAAEPAASAASSKPVSNSPSSTERSQLQLLALRRHAGSGRPSARWQERQRKRRRRNRNRRGGKRGGKRGSKFAGRRRNKRRNTHPAGAAACRERLPRAARIAGGAVPGSSTRGYNAALFSGTKRCSGALVAAAWVLTAAHCTLVAGDPVYVGGSSDRSGTLRSVRSLTRHPGYTRDRTKVINDVMLVRLDAPVANSPVRLNAAADAPGEGTVVRATGYGRDAVGGRRGPLKFVDLDVLGTASCARKFRHAGYTLLSRGIVRRYHICANHDRCDAGSCFGDSGGPLVARDRDGAVVQVGVTSYGTAECGSRDAPDVYARVSLFQAWITRVTGRQAKFVKLRAQR